MQFNNSNINKEFSRKRPRSNSMIEQFTPSKKVISDEYIEDLVEPLIEGMVNVDPIRYRYRMSDEIEQRIRSIDYKFGYGGFSECVYYRTYSQRLPDGSKENYPDTIIRVVNCVISIRYDWYVKHGIAWDEKYWNNKAYELGEYMMNFKLLPPGRGLWIAGTDYSYERGSAAFNNCGFTSLREGLVKCATWTMDSLMCGCGIGFDVDGNDEFNEIRLSNDLNGKIIYKIHDSRQGWVKSVYLLLKSYFDKTNCKYVSFDYSALRGEGVPIRGFGGVASGPEPLRILHERIRVFMKCFVNAKKDKNTAILTMIREHILIFDKTTTTYSSVISSLEYAYSSVSTHPEILEKKTYGVTRLICDIFNAIGICIVAGNVRRSSEIALGFAGDDEFLNLKNHSLNPERSILGWMSNNTVILKERKDFDLIPSIAKRILDNGEPGIMNNINCQRWGRVGKMHPIGREAEPDKAIGTNPCITGETLIQTIDGYFKVKDLVDKQFSFIHEGKTYNSTQDGFWSNGVKPVFKVITKDGYIIRCTDNHKFLFCDKNDSNDKFFCQLKNVDIDNYKIVLNPNLKHDDGFDTDFILSIEEDGEDEVFDCTIPELHYYFANGLVSHNCSEISLESFEFCNLAEIFPTRCTSFDDYKKAAELATLYSSTISLLPTHWSYSNHVIGRNRRIGVSISGITNEYETMSFAEMTSRFKDLYAAVRAENKRLSDEAGVCESIRVTTVKPSGTISQLVGVPSGIHFNTYDYCIRRIRIGTNSEIVSLLKEAGYPWEYDVMNGEGTTIFEFPLFQGQHRTAQKVTVWEQATLQASLQREWSDNSVSCTLYFDKEHEGDDLQRVLAQFAPAFKSTSALPHSNCTFPQMPYEQITKTEYEERLSQIRSIPWDKYTTKEEAIGSSGCDGEVCDLKAYMNSMKKNK